MQFRVGKLSEVGPVGLEHLFYTNREHTQALLAFKISVAVHFAKTHVHGASYCNRVMADYQETEYGRFRKSHVLLTRSLGLSSGDACSKAHKNI
jgi:hypothetical protein